MRGVETKIFQPILKYLDVYGIENVNNLNLFLISTPIIEESEDDNEDGLVWISGDPGHGAHLCSCVSSVR